MYEQVKLPTNPEIIYLRTLEKGFAVDSTALPMPLFKSLEEFAQKQAERKTVLTPEQISDSPAVQKLLERYTRRILAPQGKDFSIRPNTVIIKHYDSADEYKSKAYDFHRDPEEYSGIFGVLTLSGTAELEVQDATGKITKIYCAPNTLVTMLANNNGTFQNENPLHRISPPKDGKRDMLFFGMKG